MVEATSPFYFFSITFIFVSSYTLYFLASVSGLVSDWYIYYAEAITIQDNNMVDTEH